MTGLRVRDLRSVADYLPSIRMLHIGIRLFDLEQSLTFYSALGYAELGSVPQTEFGSLQSRLFSEKARPSLVTVIATL